MSEAQIIAKEILSQINYNIPVFWSWGSRDFKALPINSDIRGGLEFRVSGYLHKGLVRIELTYSDTYTVKLIRGKKTLKTFNDIYCDELLNVIDSNVERKAN